MATERGEGTIGSAATKVRRRQKRQTQPPAAGIWVQSNDGCGWYVRLSKNELKKYFTISSTKGGQRYYMLQTKEGRVTPPPLPVGYSAAPPEPETPPDADSLSALDAVLKVLVDRTATERLAMDDLLKRLRSRAL
jgi:hypothetical protein